MELVSTVEPAELHILGFAGEGIRLGLVALQEAFHNLLEADHILPAVDRSHLVGRIPRDSEKAGHIHPVADLVLHTVDRNLSEAGHTRSVEERRTALVVEHHRLLAVALPWHFRPFHHTKDQCCRAGA